MNSVISIIVPVYNVEKYLEKCVFSLLNQSYQQLEIILINDGSTDSSGEICNRFAEKDKRIVTIHQSNQGVSTARNAGLQRCKGDYISFVDADDFCDEQMFKKLVDKIKSTKAEAAACGYYIYEHDLENPHIVGLNQVDDCNYPKALYEILRLNGYMTSSHGKLYLHEKIFEGNAFIPFDQSVSYGEDELWLFTVLQKCKHIAFLPEPLYHWRARDGSLTRMKTNDPKQMSFLKVIDKSVELLPADQTVIALFKASSYEAMHILKVRAYCSGNETQYQMIADTEKKHELKKYWLRSSETTQIRKIKVLLIELLMRLHARKTLVEKVESIH